MFYSGSAIANTALIDLRHFAETYEPIPAEGSAIPDLPIPPKGIEAAIGFMKDNNYKHHEEYIILVFLKLYRFHIENFHQSYDLRDSNRQVKNPLLVELCRLWKLRCDNVEFLPSSIVYKSIKEKNTYGYPKIDEELARINAAIESVNKN